jgi:hypothetical protein
MIEFVVVGVGRLWKTRFIPIPIAQAVSKRGQGQAEMIWR